jgi:glycosyltransferase involved in cell wall biosynthesis
VARVSVLMPTHNRAHLLRLAVASVLAQTHQDFEILLVADGCTDDTIAVARDFAEPRIRIFDLPKAPHFGYANRNIALRHATGDIVAFAAHDNVLFPDHLERLVARLEHSDSDWAYSRPLWVSADGVIVPFTTDLTNREDLADFMAVSNTLPATCIVYRRSCLERFGEMPEDVAAGADWEHWKAFVRGGARVAFDPVPTCLHFSADWRRSRHSNNRTLRRLLNAIDCDQSWPAGLRIAIPAGASAQAVVAATMQHDKNWVSRVRFDASDAVRRVSQRPGGFPRRTLRLVAPALRFIRRWTRRGATPRAAHGPAGR